MAQTAIFLNWVIRGIIPVGRVLPAINSPEAGPGRELQGLVAILICWEGLAMIRESSTCWGARVWPFCAFRIKGLHYRSFRGLLVAALLKRECLEVSLKLLLDLSAAN